MRRRAWLLTGVGLLACNASERLVADPFDAARTAPAPLDAGTGAGGSVCPASSLGPVQEGSGRYTVAWTFATTAGPDAGTTGADAGSTETVEAPSRCVVSTVSWADSYQKFLCRGGAWLRPGAAGPVLTFDDGSTLTWNPDAPPAPAPYVQPPGERVWARYETGLIYLCNTCNSYGTDKWIEIRDRGSSGTIRHYAQQGTPLSSGLDLARQMLGVDVTETALCSIHVDGCVSLDRTEYGHRVATAPPQTIPFAALTTVTAPGGTYDLLWATTSETNIAYTCPDTPGYTNDDGFVATRRAP